CHLGAFGGATGIVSLGVTSIGGLGSFSSSDCELPTYDLGGNRIAFHACYELPGATSWELVEGEASCRSVDHHQPSAHPAARGPRPLHAVPAPLHASDGALSSQDGRLAVGDFHKIPTPHRTTVRRPSR